MDELMDGLVSEWEGWREREEGEKKEKRSSHIETKYIE